MKQPNNPFKMKTMILLLAVLMALFASTSVQADTLGSVTTSYTTNFLTLIGPGTTNVAAANNGVYVTNTFIVVPPTKSLTITNLDAGQTNIYTYFIQPPGLTNLIALGYSTNVYSTSGTTNQTIVPATASIPFQLIMSAQILGAHTNGFYAP